MTRCLALLAVGLLLAATLPLPALADPLRAAPPPLATLYPAQFRPAAQATFRLPPGIAALPVSWEGVPLDPGMSPEAWAPMETGPTISGAFEPGRWRIAAHAADGVTYSAIVTLAPGQVAEITLPVQSANSGATADPRAPCAAPACPVVWDGLALTLPQGWWMEPPAWASATAGAYPLDRPRVDFHGPDGASLHLNPHQWLRDNGPCQETAAGLFCQWRDATPATAQAAATMAPTLQLLDRPPPGK